MRVVNNNAGGHLAFRCAFDTRVAAAVCYFATDIHSHSLGEGKRDDSLHRAGDIKGEILMVGPKTLIFKLPDETCGSLPISLSSPSRRSPLVSRSGLSVSSCPDPRQIRRPRTSRGSRPHSQNVARQGSLLQLLRNRLGPACVFFIRARPGASIHTKP